MYLLYYYNLNSLVENIPTSSKPSSTPEGKKHRKMAGYKDSQEMVSPMSFDPTDGCAIQERRDFIKVQCVRCGQVFHKPFEDFYPAMMYKLVTVVNPDVQVQYGTGGPTT